MFNLGKNQKIATKPTEKYLREEEICESNDGQSIFEKVLDRSGYNDTTIEDQFIREAVKDDQVIEKILNEAEGSYITHRDETTWLQVPPMSALLEKIRQARLDNDWKEKKTKHWSESNDTKQMEGLPEWPMQPSQHENISLNNDPRRFTDLKANETQLTGGEIKPLTGSITTADVDNLAHSIKTGKSIDFDTALLAILKKADSEQRELTAEERKSVVQIKIARTKSLLKK